MPKTATYKGFKQEQSSYGSYVVKSMGQPILFSTPLVFLKYFTEIQFLEYLVTIVFRIFILIGNYILARKKGEKT